MSRRVSLRLTRPLIFIITLIPLLAAGCSGPQPQPSQQPQAKAMEIEKDVHSFARPQDVVVTHMDIDLDVDFDKRRILGKNTLRIDNKTGASQLHLDTRDLIIARVSLDDAETDTRYSLGDEVKFLGKPLVIDIKPETKSVNVHYMTSPDAAALQWLTPEQTAGGKRPFLFTQSQAILARTWVPCQDSPGIRTTYKARVKAPPDLLAVMSAKNTPEKNAEGVYQFEMDRAVPSYLLALAVGDIAFRPLGSRSGVYAEPATVDRAAAEFVDLEKMITAAESLYGPYRWERYDVIVLPPSFPFGGMENPRLTFATPTILAGDRSLVSLIAHELAHSWSGNLVTNATWNDFWLNEGFTTYFEHRIMEAINGRDYSEMLAQLTHQELLGEIEGLKEQPDDTKLFLNLDGRDPDEGSTEIAYDKGYFFLRLLEESVGRERWDAFLRKYFDTFAFQSMTTTRFLAYLRENLIQGDKALEDKLKIDEWVYGRGLPDNSPRVSPKQFEIVEAQVKAWTEGTPAKDLKTDGWTTHHWLHFLSKLPPNLKPEQMADLDVAFNFTNTGNAEILSAWLLRAIASQYKPAYPALEKFLTGMGRRKFLRPLYAEMAKTPEGMAMAQRIYAKARPTYHSVSYTAIDPILKWKAPAPSGGAQ
ncbi:MAG TPA: M1 family metallopeptidase [Blastocatellia bacterium]|nr:M1 family metallopeptidase [Blastocatellia bacterium]